MKYLVGLTMLLAALLFFMVTMFSTASAQESPPVPDISLLALTCDEASQAAAAEGLHVNQCRRYGDDAIDTYKATISVTVRTAEAGKFIVTLHYYKSPWWASGLEVVKA